MNDAPSAYKLQRVISLAQSTLETLRREHGQIIETADEITAALAAEDVSPAAIFTALVNASVEAGDWADILKARILDLSARRARFERQQETHRETILAVLGALDLRTYKDPAFTLTISDGRAKLIITDETKLPKSLTEKTITYAPKKAEIKAKLETGATVPGAVLSNPAPVLTVRVK